MYVTILCSSQLDLEKLKASALFFILSFLTCIGEQLKNVVSLSETWVRESYFGGGGVVGFFLSTKSHITGIVGGGGNKNENKQICFSSSYFPLISRIQMGASVGV